MQEIDVKLDGAGRRFAIVVARFNTEITERLLQGATATLRAHGVLEPDILVARVPGAFELPFACKQLAERRAYAAVIALGAVIRGETPHFDYVCAETARGILGVGLRTGVPVIFGVLTCDTIEQARARAGGTVAVPRVRDATGKEQERNKGASAALAALEMAALQHAIGKL